MKANKRNSRTRESPNRNISIYISTSKSMRRRKDIRHDRKNERDLKRDGC